MVDDIYPVAVVLVLKRASWPWEYAKHPHNTPLKQLAQNCYFYLRLPLIQTLFGPKSNKGREPLKIGSLKNYIVGDFFKIVCLFLVILGRFNANFWYKKFWDSGRPRPPPLVIELTCPNSQHMWRRQSQISVSCNTQWNQQLKHFLNQCSDFQYWSYIFRHCKFLPLFYQKWN